MWSSSDGSTWLSVSNNAAWGPREDPVSIVYDDKIFIIGGGNGTHVLNDVWSMGLDMDVTGDSDRISTPTEKSLGITWIGVHVGVIGLTVMKYYGY